MTPVREAAQQALGFVTSEAWGTTPYMDVRVYEDAARLRDVLQAALAQQAEPAQEPVAICCNCLGTKRPHADDPEWKGRCDCEPPQLAEPAQEPVAWRSENANPPGGYVIFQQYPQALADLGKPIQPLYTAPPQRKLVPLTAQELDGVIESHVGGSEITDDMYTSMEQFARAVEKASWEKNHG